MATDSTLQKIADNLLAQFDKTLLDNSTDFSSCDQILNAAPSEHKGGLESLYCDLLLDALISGYYRYSEMDTKQLVDDPLYTKFKKMVYGLDRSDPYNLNEATINEFGRFDELKKSVDKTKAKAFFEAYEQTKLIPPKVNMKTDQLLRQFILTGGFEVDMP